MSSLLPQSVERLIEAFAQLPGIGPRTAQRLVFHLIRSDPKLTDRLAEASKGLFAGIQHCAQCHLIATEDHCVLCRDVHRDQGLICVVAEAFDVIAIESTGDYRGVYHVLGGQLSPLDGIGPEQLSIDSLMHRAQSTSTPIREIILATNPTLEGEATAMYLAKLLADSGITVSRIARGVPVGGDLEYASALTLSNAMHDRTSFSASI